MIMAYLALEEIPYSTNIAFQPNSMIGYLTNNLQLHFCSPVCWELIKEFYPEAKSIVILCPSVKNGRSNTEFKLMNIN